MLGRTVHITCDMVAGFDGSGRHSIFRSSTDSGNIIFGGVRLIRHRCDDVIIYEEASLGSDTEIPLFLGARRRKNEN